jgi:hypothetical protein
VPRMDLTASRAQSGPRPAPVRRQGGRRSPAPVRRQGGRRSPAPESNTSWTQGRCALTPPSSGGGATAAAAMAVAARYTDGGGGSVRWRWRCTARYTTRILIESLIRTLATPGPDTSLPGHIDTVALPIR